MAQHYGFCANAHVRLPVSARRTVSTRCVEKASLEGRALCATLALSSLLVATPAFAIVSAEPCIKGEGPGCEAAAQESPLIRELLEKTRQNREKNDRKLLEDYWMQGYSDYFDFGFRKKLIKSEDGTWSLEDPDDLQSQIERRIIESIRSKK